MLPYSWAKYIFYDELQPEKKNQKSDSFIVSEKKKKYSNVKLTRSKRRGRDETVLVSKNESRQQRDVHADTGLYFQIGMKNSNDSFQNGGRRVFLSVSLSLVGSRRAETNSFSLLSPCTISKTGAKYQSAYGRLSCLPIIFLPATSPKEKAFRLQFNGTEKLDRRARTRIDDPTCMQQIVGTQLPLPLCIPPRLESLYLSTPLRFSS